ncbi:MAG: SUMF1/EgtB/PvdO family nonheme iron enzyme [Paraclostridium sp.]
MSFIFSVKDSLRASVEANSGGKNTVLYDDKGNPSIMVEIPKFKIKDVIDGGSDAVHPAFIINGVEKESLFIGKYQACVHDNRLYSLPGQDPANYINFDNALKYGYNKGDGWHLMSNAEFAAISLWCKKNGFMPRGNNNYGCDHVAVHEKGKATHYNNSDTKQIGRCATGSGPASWSHDGTPDGIFDLNGNVWEWNSGMRLMNGEIQIIENNNAAILNADHSVNSALWKAILPDGTLVTPGTSGTLKWDYTSNKITLATTITTQADASRSNTFESILKASGVEVPEILKSLILHPNETGYMDDNVWMNNNGERLPFRCGSFLSTASAGVFALNLHLTRPASGNYIGARVAFAL